MRRVFVPMSSPRSRASHGQQQHHRHQPQQRAASQAQSPKASAWAPQTHRDACMTSNTNLTNACGPGRAAAPTDETETNASGESCGGLERPRNQCHKHTHRDSTPAATATGVADSPAARADTPPSSDTASSAPPSPHQCAAAVPGRQKRRPGRRPRAKAMTGTTNGHTSSNNDTCTSPEATTATTTTTTTSATSPVTETRDDRRSVSKRHSESGAKPKHASPRLGRSLTHSSPKATPSLSVALLRHHGGDRGGRASSLMLRRHTRPNLRRSEASASTSPSSRSLFSSSSSSFSSSSSSADASRSSASRSDSSSSSSSTSSSSSFPRRSRSWSASSSSVPSFFESWYRRGPLRSRRGHIRRRSDRRGKDPKEEGKGLELTASGDALARSTATSDAGATKPNPPTLFLVQNYDVFLQVCSFLPPESCCTLLGVNRACYRAITEADLIVWREKCLSRLWRGKQGFSDYVAQFRLLLRQSTLEELQILSLQQRMLLSDYRYEDRVRESNRLPPSAGEEDNCGAAAHATNTDGTAAEAPTVRPLSDWRMGGAESVSAALSLATRAGNATVTPAAPTECSWEGSGDSATCDTRTEDEQWRYQQFFCSVLVGKSGRSLCDSDSSGDGSDDNEDDGDDGGSRDTTSCSDDDRSDEAGTRTSERATTNKSSNRQWRDEHETRWDRRRSSAPTSSSTSGAASTAAPSEDSDDGESASAATDDAAPGDRRPAPSPDGAVSDGTDAFRDRKARKVTITDNVTMHSPEMSPMSFPQAANHRNAQSGTDLASTGRGGYMNGGRKGSKRKHHSRGRHRNRKHRNRSKKPHRSRKNKGRNKNNNGGGGHHSPLSRHSRNRSRSARRRQQRKRKNKQKAAARGAAGVGGSGPVLFDDSASDDHHQRHHHFSTFRLPSATIAAAAAAAAAQRQRDFVLDPTPTYEAIKSTTPLLSAAASALPPNLSSFPTAQLKQQEELQQQQQQLHTLSQPRTPLPAADAPARHVMQRQAPSPPATAGVTTSPPRRSGAAARERDTLQPLALPPAATAAPNEGAGSDDDSETYHGSGTPLWVPRRGPALQQNSDANLPSAFGPADTAASRHGAPALTQTAAAPEAASAAGGAHAGETQFWWNMGEEEKKRQLRQLHRLHSASSQPCHSHPAGGGDNHPHPHRHRRHCSCSPVGGCGSNDAAAHLIGDSRESPQATPALDPATTDAQVYENNLWDVFEKENEAFKIREEARRQKREAAKKLKQSHKQSRRTLRSSTVTSESDNTTTHNRSGAGATAHSAQLDSSDDDGLRDPTRRRRCANPTMTTTSRRSSTPAATRGRTTDAASTSGGGGAAHSARSRSPSSASRASDDGAGRHGSSGDRLDRSATEDGDRVGSATGTRDTRPTEAAGTQVDKRQPLTVASPAAVNYAELEEEMLITRAKSFLIFSLKQSDSKYYRLASRQLTYSRVSLTGDFAGQSAPNLSSGIAESTGPTEEERGATVRTVNHNSVDRGGASGGSANLTHGAGDRHPSAASLGTSEGSSFPPAISLSVTTPSAAVATPTFPTGPLPLFHTGGTTAFDTHAGSTTSSSVVRHQHQGVSGDDDSTATARVSAAPAPTPPPPRVSSAASLTSVYPTTPLVPSNQREQTDSDFRGEAHAGLRHAAVAQETPTAPDEDVAASHAADPREDEEDSCTPISWKFAYYMSLRESRRAKLTVPDLLQSEFLLYVMATRTVHRIFFSARAPSGAGGAPVSPSTPNVWTFDKRPLFFISNSGQLSELEREVSLPSALSTAAATAPSYFPFHILQGGASLVLHKLPPFKVQRRSARSHAGGARRQPPPPQRQPHLPSPTSSDMGAEPRRCLGWLRLLQGAIADGDDAAEAAARVRAALAASHDVTSPPHGEGDDSDARPRAKRAHFLARVEALQRQHTENMRRGSQRHAEGENHSPRRAEALPEATPTNSAEEVADGTPETMRRFPLSVIPEDFTCATLSHDDDGVDDDWGWTFSNPIMKIFSVDIHIPLFVQQLQRLTNVNE